ncbi:hypothetical protein ACLI1A_00750 [Flavobacterium sp. RHBU_3]|uniref:hypothetical protein n=1 Tax=Flavobacterium sp. RHBU_3 TaxID=3391184 RepID=UPI0039851460
MNNRIYFIDIVYYTCYKFYSKYEKDLNEFSGQVLTSLCLSCNIIIILILIEEFNDILFFGNKWNSLFISLPVMLLTVIRYSKFITIAQIEDELHSKRNKQVRLIPLAVAYIIVSIFGFLAFVIIMGEINNPPPFWEK